MHCWVTLSCRKGAERGGGREGRGGVGDGGWRLRWVKNRGGSRQMKTDGRVDG